MQRSRLKYSLYLLSGGLGVSLAYQAYKWIWQLPICPNYDKTQQVSIRHVFACTVRIPNPNQSCSGLQSMRKIGAATGINYKLKQQKSVDNHSSIVINLNENPITLCNLFDNAFMEDYVHTLGDLVMKLDDEYRLKLLSNQVGYYIFLCPECHSTLTRRMISCTSYLYDAGLSRNTVDLSDIHRIEEDN